MYYRMLIIFIKVTLVRYKYSNQLYAMKTMNKLNLVEKQSTRSILNERDVLSELINYPYILFYFSIISSFLVNLILAFQDKENLYLIMDYLDGGDLRAHLLRIQMI